MKERLFIRYHDEDYRLVDGLLVSANGQPAAEQYRGELADMQSYAQGRQVVVVIPSEPVLLSRVEMPKTSRQRVIQALPYMLEDNLLTPTESLHFALGSRDEEGYQHCALIDDVLMQSWQTRLAATGVAVSHLVPDVFMLPYDTESWSVLLLPGRAVVRTGVQSGFACELESLTAMLVAALQEYSETPPKRLQYFDKREQPSESINNFVPSDQALEVDYQPVEQPLVAFFATHYDPQQSINLLQGHYSYRENMGRYWRPWRASAILILALLLVQSVGFLYQYLSLESELAELDKQVEQQFRKTFPEIKRIVNPRIQMERVLKEHKGSAEEDALFGLLAHIGTAMQKNTSIDLQSVSYRDARLEVKIQTKALPQLESFEQALKQSSAYRIEVLSANAGKEQVEAKIAIRQQAAGGQ